MRTAAVNLPLAAALAVLALAPAACDAGPAPGDGASAGAAAPATSAQPAPSFDAQWAAREAEVMAPFQRDADDALAADVKARIDDARKRFGAKVPVRVLAGRFVLVGVDPRAPFDAAADLAARALDVFARRFFARLPDRAVSVYLAGSHDRYATLCDRVVAAGCWTESGSLGIYDRPSRSIVVNLGPGLPSLLHEIVHPLVQTDFVWAPLWLDEGIAALFEQPVFSPPGELHGATNWRRADLTRALASPSRRAEVRPSALFAMSNDDFDRDDELHYALARFVCQWLDERGQLWPFYRAWRDSFAEDPSGEKTFARVTGLTPGRADAVWLEWFRALAR